MTDDTSDPARRPRFSCTGATVTDIATRRRAADVLESITFVFDGVNYGTIPVSLPYRHDKPIVLYLYPAATGAVVREDGLSGPLDCLLTDDATLAPNQEAAR